MDFLIIILLCILAIGAVGDLLFDAFGFGLKMLFSIILILASLYIIIKMFFVMIPLILVLGIITFVVGMIWCIKAVVKKVKNK